MKNKNAKNFDSKNSYVKISMRKMSNGRGHPQGSDGVWENRLG